MAACTGSNQTDKAAAAEVPAMPVGVMTMHLQKLPTSLEAVGQAQGAREVDVRSRVSGVLQRKLFNEGSPIKAGAAMFTVERAPYDISLQQAKATLAQRIAQLEQTHRESLRLKPLAEAKAIAQRDLDDALTNEQVARAAAESAKASLREAELNLSYTTIVAPISGIAGRSQTSEGTLLTANSDTVLATVTQAAPIWVRFSLTETEMARVRQSKANNVQLLTADGKVQLSGGRLNFAGSTVDTRIGTVPARAEFANPNLVVLPGQFVRIKVFADQISAYKVPQSAVVQTEQGAMVWVARNGKAVSTPVETGAWIGSDWAIYKGLREGDQVIIDNLIKLSPDMPVKPQGAQASAPAPAH